MVDWGLNIVRNFPQIYSHPIWSSLLSELHLVRPDKKTLSSIHKKDVEKAHFYRLMAQILPWTSKAASYPCMSQDSKMCIWHMEHVFKAKIIK